VKGFAQVSDRDDLDALVTQLNTDASRARASDEQTARLHDWLRQVVERSASDLLLVAGAPPSIKINEITITRKYGSFTFEESLAQLVRQGLLDAKEAIMRAHHPEELDRLLTA
jgi:Tfp pilus assembly pilus retraction ATPase PilT